MENNKKMDDNMKIEYEVRNPDIDRLKKACIRMVSELKVEAQGYLGKNIGVDLGGIAGKLGIHVPVNEVPAPAVIVSYKSHYTYCSIVMEFAMIKNTFIRGYLGKMITKSVKKKMKRQFRDDHGLDVKIKARVN